MMLRGQGGGGGRCLFTPSQWRELEHQTLIYKYMAAGSPVPHELVLPLRDHGFAINTAPSLRFPPSQPSLGWGCYGTAAQSGRKAEDPEPGRCRRTDGKKWRCSREAYGDSKYCDKHMHRGKNRSRKPVEAMSSSAGSGAGASYRPSALSISPPTPDVPSYGHHHLRPDASSARAAAHQISPLQLHLDASPPPSYHRYAQYGASSLFPSGGYGYGSSNKEHEEAEARRRQHCLALGADLSLDKPADAAGTATSTEKPLRLFFDEWPRGHSDGRPWMGMDQDGTRLSISTPTASPDLVVAAASRYHHHNGDE